MKLITLLMATTLSFVVANSLVATKECEAYNNLKHTKNNGLVKITSGKEYQILREQKGNYYIKVPNANPQTRWVDRECFNKDATTTDSKPKNEPKEEKKEGILSRLFSKKKKSDSVNSSLDSVLVLSWHNTFCETHSNKKECRRDGGDAKNRLVLHGLWPQPRNNVYCGVSEDIIKKDKYKMWNALPPLKLSKEVKELMQEYMPGSQSNLQRHEYYKHGSCYSKDANKYFLDALTMTKTVDSTLGEYFRANVGKKVKAINAKRVAIKLIDKDIKNKIAFKCKGRVLNEVWISLKGQGSNLKELIKNAKPIRSNCTEFIIDAPGKFRR